MQSPDSPASETFAGVPAPLQEAMSRRGFTSLTAVQRAVLGEGLEGRDLRISSQTGSGKTVALGLVLAKSLASSAREGRAPTALVITPTRELAAQVQKELEWLLEGVSDASVDVVTGGTSVGMERKRLARGPRVVVGTPGRILDHKQSGALDFSEIRQLVLDEADQMLDMGFRDELEAILEGMPAERRTHLVSATFAPEVRRLADRYQTNAAFVEGTKLGQANEDIEHVAYIARFNERYDALVNLLLLAQAETEADAEPPRTLIFVRTRADTSEVAELLLRDGFQAQPLSGDLAQAQRTRTLEGFRSGRVPLLVATDVAARGLDVPDVTTVVHLDPPTDSEVYTHRSGRTGRAGRKGRSIILVPPQTQRRVQRLLQDARVSVSWRDVPTADKVRRAFLKQTRRTLHAALTGDVGPEPAHLEYAARLLEEHDPVRVVATLLAQTELEPSCEPRDITPGRAAAEPRPLAPRAASRLAPPRGSSGSGGEGFVRYFVNYGARQGAAPNRILAMVCRRGDIEGNAIGSIDIRDNGTTFDVRGDVAAEFEAAAQRPDPREPKLRIERYREPPGGSERPRREPAPSERGGPRPSSRPRGPVPNDGRAFAKYHAGPKPHRPFGKPPARAGRPFEAAEGEGPRRVLAPRPRKPRPQGH
jgi:ATP-dependent RNA helicase DeaD